ncbi:DUF6801 domain-containing protein [Spongisporangium articulatum]|uniref:DUF6801 domain-containing protein n=1 Tax=Spongisporangium articulatum TaxID=3362603 RepID=A0ABW8ANP1_9ACTN
MVPRLARALVAAAAVVALSGIAAQAAPAPVTEAPQAAALIPVNSQMGRLRLPYTCAFPILGKQTLGLDLQGTFTTLLAPGQKYWFTDGKANIEVPSNLASLLAGLGAAYIDATVSSFTINAVNASPASVNALPNGLVLKNIPVTAGQKTVIPIAGPLTVGPFTAGPSGMAALKMGGAKASIKLKAKNGATLPIPLDVSCAAPVPDVVLAGINIGTAGDATNGAPSHGGLYTYPAVDLDHQQGSGKVPLVCQFPAPIGERTLTLTFTGDAGTVYGQGEKFYLKRASAYLEVPGPVVDALRARFPTATSVRTSISRFDIDSSGASPASLNVAGSGWTLPAQPLTAGTTLGMRIPGSDYITAGPFTAGAPGLMRLEVGVSAGTVSFLGAGGTQVGSLSISCAKRVPAVVIVPLVSAKPDPIKPVVSFLPPATGKTAGGEFATLTGIGLDQIREVYFGDVAAPYLAVGNGIVVVETPPHAAGKVTVTVRALNGTTTTPFTYT